MFRDLGGIWMSVLSVIAIDKIQSGLGALLQDLVLGGDVGCTLQEFILCPGLGIRVFLWARKGE